MTRALTALDVLPSRKAMAERAVQRLRADVDALAPAISSGWRRPGWARRAAVGVLTPA